jgi:hypothetical protein
MTFANGEAACPADGIDGCGPMFIGANGSLHVGRMGYALRPPQPRTIRKGRPVPSRGRGAEDEPFEAHVRNFIDCVRSRRAPNADMEIGYHSTLPCLLALESMRRNTALAWDARTRTSIEA